ncbi:Methyltransferase domain-containing protein [Cladophialophora immunda]|nr:Methyltransferase domain-containing protein [Cladophialophora immunda]
MSAPSPQEPDTAPATQYDQIGQSYESMKQIPGAALERSNLRDAIVPYLTLPDGRAAAVLDLACGTGYYSRLLLDWAPSLRRVVGVDISATMVGAAERSAASLDAFQQGRLRFAVGDATEPLPRTVFSGAEEGEEEEEEEDGSDSGLFDVVLGAWLLNYAASTPAMARMFANVAAALRPGGRFVGITPHPAADLDAFAAFHATPAAQAEMRRFGVSIAYLAPPLASGEGYHTRITAHVSPVEIAFDNFHLRRRVYEDAARRGGMNGELKWLEVRLPRSDDESRAEYGVGIDYWDGCEERPHFGILVVEK